MPTPTLRTVPRPSIRLDSARVTNRGRFARHALPAQGATSGGTVVHVCVDALAAEIVE